MRTFFTSSLLLLLAIPLVAQPTVDDIVARYAKRVGGLEHLQKIRTLRRTGVFHGGGGFQAAVVYENKRPGMVRQEFSFGGMTGITAYDGANGWMIQPWQGKKDVESLGENDLKSIMEEAEFDDPLLDYRRKGNTVEFLGSDQIEGTDVFKLKMNLKSTGDQRIYYIDADSYVPILIEVKRTVRGAEQEFEMELGNYKSVGGWYLPFAVAMGGKGSASIEKAQLVWEKIEPNVPIDDRRFARPVAGGVVEPETASSLDPELPVVVPAAEAEPATSTTRPVRVDSETMSGLGARNIGSAAMSGRIAAVAAVHEGDRLTIYVGAASGGVWKSKNGGTTFEPVFDAQPVQSIGAIAIDPTNPRVVWAGTGESWTRNSVSVGDGIYKSTDGGENWTNMGLPESERIAKIIVDPSNPNTVYVAVPGKLWSDSDERGVYRTTDGGKSWTKVLAGRNLSTGCSMLSIDPKNPKIIYAGMWDFRRHGWTFRSGGDGPEATSGSGLFKSIDGGTTWAELDAGSAKGLPPKPWGRVAVTVAPSNASVVYAFIEAVPPHNALYRSSDGGKTWQIKDRSQNMVWRPFYFANLIVDPKDESRVYKTNLSLIVSNDSGSTFSNINGGTHGDHHDLWIDPLNTDRLIAADDGGLWYSYDRGDRWWKAENLPISQFYHVSVDNDRPYKVYGGLQDNSSWVGESQYPGGITNGRWENLNGGDGFWMFVDPTDNDYVYAEAQGGYINRINRKTLERRDIKPLPVSSSEKLRFNWNTPIHISPTRNGTIYLGSQFLFRSTDFGQSWVRISPDLTTNDPAKQQQELSGGVTVDNSSAEMHTTIYSIAESPKDPQVIWAGTDDGNLQVTRDGGRNWRNVIGNISGLPKGAWVSSLEAGHYSAGTLYATFDLHNFGDMRTYVYRTTDYGATWKSLAGSASTLSGYAHVIKEDLVNPQLLFLGTEVGLWISVDGGESWSRYKGNDLPSVAVRDLVVHPRDHDLVIATHGRGIWIIDDITPLRDLTPATTSRRAAFLRTEPVVQRISTWGGWSSGDATFVGANPPGDAVITYFLQKRHIFGDMKLEVLDAAGTLLETLPTSRRRGLSRVSWSMRMPPARIPTAATASFGAGPRYLPGNYTVRLTEGDSVYTTELKVVADPRSKHSAADREAQFALALQLYGMLDRMTTLVDRMNGMLGGLARRASRLDAADPLAQKLRAASATADALRKKIVATREGGMITGEERLREFLVELYGSVNGYEGRPSQTQVDRTASIARELDDVSKQFDSWIASELVPINAMLEERKLGTIEVAVK